MVKTWKELTALPNGTRILNHGYDQCVALANLMHESVMKGSFIPVASAYQWWTGSWTEVNRLYYKSSKPVVGALFVARYGIYNAPDGHIGIVTAVYSNGSFDTLEQNAGTWRYLGRYNRGMANILGFLVPRVSPVTPPAPLGPKQRKVGKNPVKRRTGATTTANEKQPPLAPGVVGDFVAWKKGQQVNDGIKSTNVWFQGISGDWFWAGGFTSQSTSNLKDLNPKAPPAVANNQRKVDPTPVNVRGAASSTSIKRGELAANSIVTPEGWVTGQKVSGIDIWYKVKGGYAWAGGFTTEGKTGLKDLNPIKPTPPPTEEPKDPTAPTKDLGFPGSVLGTIENWSESAKPFSHVMSRPTPASVELPFPLGIVEQQSVPVGGFNRGREAKPNHLVLHHVVGNNVEGAKRTLMGPEAPTCNYLVKDRLVIGMVNEGDTPATNGRWKSNLYSVTVEVCNDRTNSDKPSPESHESTAWVVARAALKWGMKLPLKHGETVFGHKEVSKSSTACPGQLDLVWITDRANEIINSMVSETNPPPPEYGDLNEAITGLSKLINALIDLLKRVFKVG